MVEFLKSGDGGAWRTTKGLLMQPGAESAGNSFRVQGGGEEIPTLTPGCPC